MAAAAEAMVKQLTEVQLTFLWMERAQYLRTLSEGAKQTVKETGYQYLGFLTKSLGSGNDLTEQHTATATKGEGIFDRLKVQGISNPPANWDLTEKAREVASVLGLSV